MTQRTKYLEVLSKTQEKSETFPSSSHPKDISYGYEKMEGLLDIFH
mgnify:CR=1 FL=1